MTPDLLLSIDCSTTGVKCVVWDRSGELVSSGRAPLDLSVPAPGLGEQDPTQWWSATCQAVRSAVQDLDPAAIAAVCVAHQRESFACLDEHGEPVRPAMLWLDSRAKEEVEIAGTDRVHELTGKPPNTTPDYYKLLWLRKHEPEAMLKTRHVVDVHGYLVNRMTGHWRTSIASADPLGLVNLRTGDYDDELLAATGLTRAQLSELVAPGERIGELTSSAAHALGLLAGLPVVAGAGDGQAAALGADITRPGRAYLNLGTGLVSGCYSDTYCASRAYRALTGAIPDTFSYEVFIGAGTYMINWFVDTFVGARPGPEAKSGSIEQQLELEAACVPAGCQGLYVVPYWNGALTPYWDHDARGLMVGFTGIHTRAHIYRAVLEGLAYELRLCLGLAEDALSEPIDTLILMGGGAQSRLWCQIFADVLNKPLVIAKEQESTCLGAGMLAAAGAGLYESIRDAARAMSSSGETYLPQRELRPVYDHHFDIYKGIYPATRGLFSGATRISK